MKENITVNYETRVLISEHTVDDNQQLDNGTVLLDQSNAIHSQNMARAIARSLAREENGFIHRIAFGNGGSFTDAGETTVLNPPNDGTRGDGWESRLYNETYSEIIDDENVAQLGTDPGSSGPNSSRIGGGAFPNELDDGAGVTSQEVGRKSNVIAVMFINQNEPVGQLPDTFVDSSIEEEEKSFEFDELGFYTTGKPASPEPARSTIDVGTKTSEDSIPSSMFGSVFTFNYFTNGVSRSSEITVPVSGSGPSGEVTYGDLCEGLNTGSWVTSGDDTSVNIEVSITDRSVGAVYPSIAGDETFGLLVFETLTTGASSTIELDCTSSLSDFVYALGNESCSKADITQNSGTNAGVANDPANPENERERLLTHLTFSPILKKANRVLKIKYTLTVSVSQTGDCATNISLVSPTPTSSATPTPTPSNSGTSTPTPTPSSSGA